MNNNEKISSIETLKFVMNIHSVRQDELPEIGSQSHVSKILSGKRQLTLKHIKSLSKRFNVSPAVFF